MSNGTETDEEPLSVKLAQADVTDPEVYRKAQELERETAMKRLETERKRAEEQSLAGIVVRELANSLDPSDLVPLIEVVAKAFAQSRNEPVQAQQRNVPEPNPETSDMDSPAKQAVTETGNRS